MRLACHVMDPDRLARWLRRFGTEAVGDDSPLYARVCELAAESPELLALAVRSAEESPMVFLAAIHDELLRDPDDELAAYYPTVGGRRAPDAGLGPALTRFCGARAERLRTRSPSAAPDQRDRALCRAAPGLRGGGGGRPLAQIEIGERGAERAVGPLRL